MIRLDKTIRKLQAIADSTVSVGAHIIVSFMDHNTQGDSTKGATQLTNGNLVADTDICAAPQQNFVREIDTVFLTNKDSAAHTFTVKIDESATDYICIVHSLSAGQSLIYEHNTGWSVL